MKIMIISQHDAIEKLNLSTRAKNILRKKNIHTILSFIEFPENEFLAMKNLGTKTLNELSGYLNHIKSGRIKVVDSPIILNKEIKNFVHSDGHKYRDVCIGELGLSNRSLNCLANADYIWISEILNLNECTLKTITNMGNKSANEILRILESYKYIPYIEKDNESRHANADCVCNLVFNSLKQKMPLNATEHYNKMIDIYNAYLENNTTINELKDILEELTLHKKIQLSEYIKNVFANYLLYVISNYNYGCSTFEIFKCTPYLLQNNEFITKIIERLVNEKKIKKVEEDIYLAEHLPFVDGLKETLPEKEYNVFIERTKNYTLEEIGIKQGMTRQRIKQIETKAVKKINELRCIFKEDIYRDIYNTYNMSLEDFIIAFKCEQEYHYLFVRYNLSKVSNKSKLPLKEALLDISIPEKMRKTIEKAVYKNYVKLGSEYVICTRSDITNYILRTYATQDIFFKEFSEIYFMILEDIGKNNDEKLSIMDRGYENRLALSDTVLWKYKKKLRYYNMNNYNYDKLFETLNFAQYYNVEYSTKKFFKLYPDLMEEYDIRDEYELHNLLKKRYKSDECINWGRMPNIEFGKVSREEQVLNLLLALAPVSNINFAIAYEEEYGVSAPTVLANYLKEFEEYFHDGVYKIDVPIFSKIVADNLKSKLTNDFYLFEEIRNIYKKEFPTAELNLVNPFSIKALGFKVYSSYVVSSRFSSATEYFNYLLTKDDITDITLIPQTVRQLIQFVSQLYKLKLEYDIVEFLPNKYIKSERLLKNGISKDMIKAFNKKVFNFIGRDKYFTIKSLRKNGFFHELDEYGFEDWFYSSLLAECKNEISYLRIGRNKLFMLGKIRVKLEEFIENIVFLQENLAIDIYDLKELLEEQYGIYIPIYKLIETTKNTSMFYDTISEKIYADYDIYYEVI
ncbi:MAG: DNA-directed RNA polymerase subunit alpha C-terminal domain-containing protein [Bacilli bacterium]